MAQTAAEITIVAKEGPLASSVSRAIGKGIAGASSDFKSFERELDRANRRVVAFGASASIIYGTVRAFQDLVKVTINVEKQLASINSIFSLTQRQLDSFSRDLFNTAKITAQSFNEVSKAAEEFSRQGLGVEETAKRTRDALILVRLTGLETTKAVDLLTAAMNTFGKTGVDTTTILNKLVAVDQKFAVSAKDIAEAIARSASVIDDANVTLDQFNGLVTAARQITSREGAVIGNSLKTIFTRLERSTTLDQMEALGIAVRDASGNAKNALDIFNAVAQSYKTLNREQQTQVAELGAGVFQINQFKALLLDLGKANGIAAQATRESVNATDEALVRNAALNKTLDASVKTLQASATQAASAIGSLTLKPLASGLLNYSNIGLENLFGNLSSSGNTKAAEDFGAYLGESILKGLGNLITGPGFIAALKLVTSLATRLGKELIIDTSSTLRGFSLGEKLTRKEEANTLQTVNNLLAQGTRAEQARYQAARSVAEQEAAILAILERQVALQARAAGTPFPAATRTAFGGRGIRGAAGGYIPSAMGAERAAISAGVGGAPSSARAVLLPSFRFGGGKVGPLVANTSEYKVPNLAGGGDGIFNQSMIRKFGLPPGATPIAAGGYVPNAAGGDPFSFREGDLTARTSRTIDSQAFRPNVVTGSAPISSVTLDKLNNLFKTLSSFPNKPAAYETVEEIKSVAKTLDDISKTKVLKNLNEGLAALAFRGKLVYGKVGDGNPANALAVQSRTASGAEGVPYRPYSAPGSLLPKNQLTQPPIDPRRADAERIAAVYRQQRVEEKQAARQGEIIAQNVRIETLNERLRANASRVKARNEASLIIQPELEKAEKQRISKEALSRRASKFQFAAFGASFLSAGLPQGESGQASGKLFGSLGGAAQGAATGSVVGSFFGPKGEIGGTIIGGLIGAIKGFIDRSTKSFEELGKEIEEANSKSAQTIESAGQFLSIQGNIQEAIDRGRGGDAITNLVSQQRNIGQQLPAGILRQLLEAGFDQDKQREVIGEISSIEGKARGRRNLTGLIGSLSKNPTTEQIQGTGRALRRSTTGDFPELNRLDYIQGEAARQGAELAEAGLLIGDPSELGKKKALQLATEIISKADLTPEQRREATAFASQATANVLFGILRSFRDEGEVGPLLDISAKSGKQLESLRNPLQDLIRRRSSQLELGSIRTGLSNRVQSLREGATLEFGDLSERAKLSASGGFALASARREAATSNGLAFEGARTSLLSEVGKLGSTPALIEQVVKASGIGDLEKIVESFRGKDIKDKLSETVAELKKTVAQNDAQISLVEEQNRIEQLLLDSQQQQRLLSVGTFVRDTRSTSANLFSRIGTSFGTSRRAEGIELGNFLTQLGIPQTDAGSAFDRDLRSKSVQDNLAALLSGRLGTRVGSSREALSAATGQLGGQFGDAALASRIKEALRSLDFDPTAARKQLLDGGVSKSTLEELINKGEIGSSTLVLKRPLDVISSATEESNDILLRIEANLKQQADVGLQSSLMAESIGIQNRRASDKTLSSEELTQLIDREIAVKNQLSDVNARLDSPDRYYQELVADISQAHVEGAKAAAPEIKESIMEAFKVGASEIQGTSLENYLKSFSTGFTGSLEDSIKGPFSSIEQAMLNLQDVGAKVGASLEANLSDAFGDFVVGAAKGKDAFRAFALGVLGDSARAFASKAVQSLLGYALNAYMNSGGGGTYSASELSLLSTNARGGPIGFANGGGVPVALTGGEFVFSPSATKNLGASTVSSINAGTFQKRAGGGSIVRGGSGVRDDVFGTAPAGSFVIRKAMVERYGGGYLSSLASSASNGASFSLNATPYADGGPVASIATPSPMMVSAGGGGGGGTFNIGVVINDNSTSSSSSSSSGGQSMDRQFGEILTSRIKQITMQTIEEQQRAGGVLRPTARRT